mmetsp:Transcript_35315/g.72263  ORF Transcript_35315/g.72263 Transcript_35315/m.72263 type:complete len:300 (+) Transcript_35315:93-992(+)
MCSRVDTPGSCATTRHCQSCEESPTTGFPGSTPAKGSICRSSVPPHFVSDMSWPRSPPHDFVSNIFWLSIAHSILITLRAFSTETRSFASPFQSFTTYAACPFSLSSSATAASRSPSWTCRRARASERSADLPVSVVESPARARSSDEGGMVIAANVMPRIWAPRPVRPSGMSAACRLTEYTFSKLVCNSDKVGTPDLTVDGTCDSADAMTPSPPAAIFNAASSSAAPWLVSIFAASASAAALSRCASCDPDSKTRLTSSADSSFRSLPAISSNAATFASRSFAASAFSAASLFPYSTS